MGHYTNEIIKNARKINELQARIDETFEYRDKNDHKWKEWQKAYDDFHKEYDALAFP